MKLVENRGTSLGPSIDNPLRDLQDELMRSHVLACPSLAVEFDTFSMGHAFLTIELAPDGRIKSVLPPVIHD
ncbi:MAG: hypothetical protein HY079_03420 [Elusimicrobia bacterium]|nr:hypothetical protein [Elusimicrobiota bacterium]